MKKATTTLLQCALVLIALVPLSVNAQTYNLVWSDEFNGGMSSAWRHETGGGGWGNNEKQYYQGGNTYFTGSDLVIVAKKEAVGGMPYTSSRIITNGSSSPKNFKYGRMESRMRLPMGQGLWPAFWMLGTNIGSVGWPSCGEIDIMEHINNEATIFGTIHWQGPNGYANYGSNSFGTTPGDYHTYRVDWTSSDIKWFLDGTQYHVVNIQNSTNSTEEFHAPMYFILNLAVAGNFPGQTVDESRLPASMFVDYVRVYEPSSSSTSSNVATTYGDCSYGGSAVGLPVGDYTMGQLSSRGIANDAISSLRVSGGYEVVLYEHDNFTGAYIILGGDNSCLVNSVLGGGDWNDKTTSLKVRGRSSSSFFEAEHYAAMSGMFTEGCSEGGSNIAGTNGGDWIYWGNINFPTSGTYSIEYRIASNVGGRFSSDLNNGAIQLGAVDLPNTGGWQNWRSVYQSVYVNAGTYNFGLFFNHGEANINWIRITRNAGARLALPETDEPVANNSAKVYPTVVASTLNYTLPKGVQDHKIQIRDFQGKAVSNLSIAEAGDKNSIDLSALKSGMYLITISDKGFNKTFKIEKK